MVGDKDMRKYDPRGLVSVDFTGCSGGFIPPETAEGFLKHQAFVFMEKSDFLTARVREMTYLRDACDIAISEDVKKAVQLRAEAEKMEALV